jgi:hypothetical protein
MTALRRPCRLRPDQLVAGGYAQAQKAYSFLPGTLSRQPPWHEGRRVCVFYLGDFHAAGRCSCDQNPSQTWPPLT